MNGSSADDPANSKMLMVLEYVDGGSLFAGTKISPKKRLTELAARKYFRDVLQVPLPVLRERERERDLLQVPHFLVGPLQPL